MRWLWLLMYKWLFTWTIYFLVLDLFFFFSFSSIFFCAVFKDDFLFFSVWFTKLPQFTTSERKKIGRRKVNIFHRTSDFNFKSSWIFLPLSQFILSKFKRFCSQNSPIVFGSIWYAGMPQWAGGGVVRWSPLWQKNGVNPILLACKDNKKKTSNKDFSKTFNRIQLSAFDDWADKQSCERLNNNCCLVTLTCYPFFFLSSFLILFWFRRMAEG